MAQLVAHLHGMEGVGSSNLPSSTGKASKDFLGSLFHIPHWPSAAGIPGIKLDGIAQTIEREGAAWTR